MMYRYDDNPVNPEMGLREEPAAAGRKSRFRVPAVRPAAAPGRQPPKFDYTMMAQQANATSYAPPPPMPAYQPPAYQQPQRRRSGALPPMLSSTYRPGAPTVPQQLMMQDMQDEMGGYMLPGTMPGMMPQFPPWLMPPGGFTGRSLMPSYDRY